MVTRREENDSCNAIARLVLDVGCTTGADKNGSRIPASVGQCE